MAVIHRTNESGVPHFALSGAFALHSAVQFRDELLALLDAHKQVCLDLVAVDDFDSSAVQVLLFMQREALQRGVFIEWGGVSAVVAQVLQLLGLNNELGLLSAAGTQA